MRIFGGYLSGYTEVGELVCPSSQRVSVAFDFQDQRVLEKIGIVREGHEVVVVLNSMQPSYLWIKRPLALRPCLTTSLPLYRIPQYWGFPCYSMSIGRTPGSIKEKIIIFSRLLSWEVT